jgi:hypothetical protein
VGRLHEDEFVTYKTIFLSQKVVFVDLPLYFYFQRSDSIMGAPFNFKRAFDAMDAVIERYDFFLTNEIDLLEETYFFYYQFMETRFFK